jgi:hypothetical protein
LAAFGGDDVTRGLDQDQVFRAWWLPSISSVGPLGSSWRIAVISISTPGIWVVWAGVVQ